MIGQPFVFLRTAEGVSRVSSCILFCTFNVARERGREREVCNVNFVSQFGTPKRNQSKGQSFFPDGRCEEEFDKLAATLVT